MMFEEIGNSFFQWTECGCEGQGTNFGFHKRTFVLGVVGSEAVFGQNFLFSIDFPHL